jgi:hypothetical protein
MNCQLAIEGKLNQHILRIYRVSMSAMQIKEMAGTVLIADVE